MNYPDGDAGAAIFTASHSGARDGAALLGRIGDTMSRSGFLRRPR